MKREKFESKQGKFDWFWLKQQSVILQSVITVDDHQMLNHVWWRAARHATLQFPTKLCFGGAQLQNCDKSWDNNWSNNRLSKQSAPGPLQLADFKSRGLWRRRMRSAAGEYALATSGDFTLLHCWVSKKFIILPPWYGVEGSRDGAFPLFWWKQRGGTGRGSQVGLWVPGMRADRGCAAEISEAGPCPGSWTDPLKLGPTKPQNPGTLLGTLKVPQNMQTWEKLPKLSGLLSNLHCCWKSLSMRKKSSKIYQQIDFLANGSRFGLSIPLDRITPSRYGSIGSCISISD